MTCAYCGRSVRTWANGKARMDGTKLHYYGCRHLDKKSNCPNARMIPQHIVDDLVITNMINTLSNIEQLKTCWLALDSKTNPATQIKQLTSEIAELEKKKSRLINAITEGIIEFADAKNKRIELDTATAACKKRLAEIEQIDPTQPRWDDLMLTRHEWEQMTIHEHRDIIPTILTNISISNSKLLLTYKFPRHADGRKTAKINLPTAGKGGPKQLWKTK